MWNTDNWGHVPKTRKRWDLSVFWILLPRTQECLSVEVVCFRWSTFADHLPLCFGLDFLQLPVVFCSLIPKLFFSNTLATSESLVAFRSVSIEIIRHLPLSWDHAQDVPGHLAPDDTSFLGFLKVLGIWAILLLLLDPFGLLQQRW